MILQTEKKDLRQVLQTKRLEIPSSRKLVASIDSFRILSRELSCYQKVLSFAPLSQEISLWPLNTWLAKQGKLYLPKVSNKELLVFPIQDPERQLSVQSFGVLEPNLPSSRAISANKLDCALIPGLGFDLKGYRLGYGKGFYDLFLKTHPQILKIGVGFKEQKLPSCPFEEHDQVMDKVYFF